MGELSPETTKALLRRMLLIRRAEEQVIHFATDYKELLTGHYHVYIGQEATGVGVCHALQPGDYLFTTHRNHGHVIARGGEPGPVLAEIIGRVGGYNRGRGGTFHVSAPHLGILHTSAIVAGCIPLAAGAALSAQQRGTSQISVAFFGEGAMDEGASYEALSIAALWTLPVLFVCETNGTAGGSQEKGGRGPQLVERALALGITAEVVDGTRLAAVCDAAGRAVDRLRAGSGPVFLQVQTGNTWPGHSGGRAVLQGGDFDLAWAYDAAAAPQELREWIETSDSVSILLRDLDRSGVLSRAAAIELDSEVRTEIEAAAKMALESPYPSPEGALQHVFGR